LIEQAMIFALGFFVAGLLALLFLPAVQRRAAGPAARRLEMLLPLSMEEIVAERDQLRAEFAVGQRRIERKLEAAADAQAIHMGEIGRQAAAILQLQGELAETKDELRGVGEARDALQQQLHETEAAVAAVEKALHDEGAFHAATRERLETLGAEHFALEQVAHERRATVAGLETRAASLDLRIMALNHQKEELERNLQGKTSEAEVLLVERDLARAERDGLETKRATLQRRLDEEALRTADLRDQIEALRRRVEEADRTRVAGEQARDTAAQRHARAAKKVDEQEETIRSLQTAAAERHAMQVAEIATLGGQLEAARREHASLKEERRVQSEAARKLEAQIVKAREAEAEWRSRYEKQAAEIAALTAQSAVAAPAGAAAAPDLAVSQREETALLRQAIADLGSEVVRIASSLKTSDTAEDGAPMPPDMRDVRERRGRARAQP
jgi:chromosome segregation ATPase